MGISERGSGRLPNSSKGDEPDLNLLIAPPIPRQPADEAAEGDYFGPHILLKSNRI